METSSRKMGVQSRLLALLLTLAMVIGVCPAAFADEPQPRAAQDDYLNFKISGEVVSEVPTGKEMTLAGHYSIREDSFTEGDELRLYLGDMTDERLTQINVNTIVDGNNPAVAIDNIYCEVGYDEELGQKYLKLSHYKDGEVIDWKDGDTAVFNLRALFNVDAKDGSTWTVQLKEVNPNSGEKKDIGQPVTVTATSSITVNNKKTVSKTTAILDEPTGAATLGEDITYTLQAYAGNKAGTSTALVPGERIITRMRMTDTLTLPAGITIPVVDGSAEASIRAAIDFSVENYTITDYKTDSTTGDISGFTIEYDKVNPESTQRQIPDSVETLTLKGDKVNVSEDFTETVGVPITNTLKTTAKDVDGAAYNPPAQTVKTNVRRPKTDKYGKKAKVIEKVGSPYGNEDYVVEGDYVLYKITFTNRSDNDVAGGVIVDDLPEGLEVIGTDEVAAAKARLGYWQWQGDSPYWSDNGTVDVNNNGAVEFKLTGVTSGNSFNGYIVCKVTGELTEEDGPRPLTNTATFPDEDTVSVDIEQQPKSPNVVISKSADKQSYRIGDDITYTITLDNTTGSADTTVSVTDNFPSEYLDFVSSAPDYTSVNGADYTWDGVSVAAGDKTEIKVNATVKAGTKEPTITNYASLDDGDPVSADIVRINPASDVEISKSIQNADVDYKTGDEITYIITVDTKGYTFSNGEKLGIIDNFPDIVANPTVTTSTEGATASYNNNTKRIEVTGTGVIEIQVTGTVTSDSGSLKNTASVYVPSGDRPYAETEDKWAGVTGAWTVRKKATVSNGTVIESGKEGVVNPGDEITFEIAVTNNGDPVTNLEIEDEILGYYDLIDEQHPRITINKEKTSKNITGIDKRMIRKYVWVNTDPNNELIGEDKLMDTVYDDKTYFEFNINEKWPAYGDTKKTIKFSADDEAYQGKYANNPSNNAEWINYQFCMPKGSTLVLEYTVKASEQLGNSGVCFTGGSNKVSVNGTDSTVSYEPGQPDNPDNPDETPAPQLPTLSMEKKVYNYSGKIYNDSSSRVEIANRTFGSTDEMREGAFGSTSSRGAIAYGLRITNNSNETYEATGATFIDFLPKDLRMVSVPNINNFISQLDNWSITIDSVNVACVPEDSDYKDAKWEPYEEAAAKTPHTGFDTIDGCNAMAVSIHNATRTNANGEEEKVLRLAPNEFVFLIYTLQIDQEMAGFAGTSTEPKTLGKIDEMLAKGEKIDLPETNTAYYTSNEYFKNTAGDTVRVLGASTTVNLRMGSVNPGIKKTAYASFTELAQNIRAGSAKAAAGSYLIWKLRVNNGDDADKSGLPMSNYVLKDILPAGYKYVNGNAVIADTVTFPASMEDVGRTNNLSEAKSAEYASFKDGKFVKHTVRDDGTDTVTGYFDYFEPEKGTEVIDGVERDTLVWEFTDAEYTLQKNEYLEFVIITQPETYENDGVNEYKSGVFYNKAELTVADLKYEDTVTAGTVEDGNIVDGDSFSVNSIVTTSQISVVTKDDKGTELDNATGGTDKDLANGLDEGEARYTLTVSVDPDASSITNISVINRLPYEGDRGVIVSGARGSEGTVTYQNNMTITITDANGNVVRTLTGSEYTLTTYSADANKVFSEESQDWKSGYMNGWGKTFDDSTKLVRIQLSKDIELAPGQSLNISYDAKLPAAGTEDIDVWNSFAYYYNGVSTAQNTNMASEPAKVGVTIPKSEHITGVIKIKKVYAAPEKGSKKFYFSIFNAPYNGQAPIETKSVTVSNGGGVNNPSNAEIRFEDLPITEIGKSINYYIYETDRDGVPIKQDIDGNGYAMFTGFYRTDGNYGRYETEPYKTGTNGEAIYTNAGTKKSEITLVNDGDYVFLYKGLNPSMTENSAIFSNIVPEETIPELKKIFGPYYADIPSNYAALKTGDAIDDKLTSGVKKDGKHTVKDNNETITDGQRALHSSYEEGKEIFETKNYKFENGWGEMNGHTVSTGFMAQFSGLSGTINQVVWKISSNPSAQGDNDVFVKLPADETEAHNTQFAKSLLSKYSGVYKLEKAFTDDQGDHGTAIYRIKEDQSGLSELSGGVSTSDSSENENTSVGVGADEIGGIAEVAGDGDKIIMDSDVNDIAAVGEDSIFADDAALEEANKVLSWTIVDVLPQITLDPNATINIGIILDGIYDREMTADLDTFYNFNDNPEGANQAKDHTVGDHIPQSDVLHSNGTGDFRKEVLKSIEASDVGHKWDLTKKGDSFGGISKTTAATTLDTTHKIQLVGMGISMDNSGTRIGSGNQVGANNYIDGSIAMIVPAGTVLEITAKGGDPKRALEIYTVSDAGVVSSAIDAENTPEYRTSNENGDIEGVDYKGVVNKTGVFFGSPAEEKEITLKTGGTVFFKSTGSNIMIESIKVVRYGYGN